MAVQDASFGTFLVAFAMMLGPIAFHLHGAFFGLDAAAWTGPALSATPPAYFWRACAALFAVAAAGYGGLRWALPKLGWKLSPKSMSEHREDLLRLAHSVALLSAFGRLEARLFGQGAELLGEAATAQVGRFGLYLCWFSLLFELLRKVNVQVNAGLRRNHKGVVVVGLAVAVLLAVLRNHVALAELEGLSPGLPLLLLALNALHWAIGALDFGGGGNAGRTHCTS